MKRDIKKEILQAMKKFKTGELKKANVYNHLDTEYKRVYDKASDEWEYDDVPTQIVTKSLDDLFKQIKTSKWDDNQLFMPFQGTLEFENCELYFTDKSRLEKTVPYKKA